MLFSVDRQNIYVSPPNAKTLVSPKIPALCLELSGEEHNKSCSLMLR